MATHLSYLSDLSDLAYKPQLISGLKDGEAMNLYSGSNHLLIGRRSISRRSVMRNNPIVKHKNPVGEKDLKSRVFKTSIMMVRICK
jgi:hypothetical protein